MCGKGVFVVDADDEAAVRAPRRDGEGGQAAEEEWCMRHPRNKKLLVIVSLAALFGPLSKA